MKYLEIDKSMRSFGKLTLDDILLKIRMYSSSYLWSIQIIDGVGDIESIIGMSIVDLEIYCDNSENGYVTDLDVIVKLAKACSDIVDIVVVACQENSNIPKAYKDGGWEKACEVIISREDSSLWLLTSKNSQIMDEFYSLMNP